MAILLQTRSGARCGRAPDGTMVAMAASRFPILRTSWVVPALLVPFAASCGLVVPWPWAGLVIVLAAGRVVRWRRERRHRPEVVVDEFGLQVLGRRVVEERDLAWSQIAGWATPPHLVGLRPGCLARRAAEGFWVPLRLHDGHDVVIPAVTRARELHDIVETRARAA